MKLVCERHRLLIIPEAPLDIAFLEEVIGLKKEGANCLATRVNAMGLFSMAYLELKKDETIANKKG